MHLSNRGQAFFILLLSAVFLVNDQDRCIMLALILLCYAIGRRREIEFDLGDILLFITPVYFQLIYGTGIADGLYLGLGYVAFYQLGKCVEFPVKAVIISSIVFAAKGVLGFTYVFRFGRNFVDNAWPDWSGDLMLRSAYEYWLIILAVLLIYFIIITVKGNHYGVIGILGSIAVVSVAIYGRGRLTFITCVVTTFTVLIGIVIKYNLLEQKKYRYIGAGLLAAVMIFAVLYVFNAFGIYKVYRNSMWFGSSGILHEQRFSMMYQQIKLMLSSPFSSTETIPVLNKEGIEVLTISNSWLQLGKEGGIVTMLFALAFTVTNIFCLIKVWAKDDKISKYAVIAAFIGVLFLNMVEACVLYIGTFWFVLIYLGGMLRGMYNELSEKN